MLTKNIATLERQYAKLRVDVMNVACDCEGYLIATSFCCHECGCVWSPDAARARRRHNCPNGCNDGMKLR